MNGEDGFCLVDLCDALCMSNQRNLRSAKYFAEYYPSGLALIRATVDRLEPDEVVPIGVDAGVVNAAIVEHVRTCRRHDA